MKSLSIPFFSDLSNLPLNEIDLMLKSEAPKHEIDILNWPTLYPTSPTTTFTLVRDQKQLYIRYQSTAKSLKATYSEDLSPVWTDSCVELFVQVLGDARYTNFEFNCIGVCYAAKRISREEFTLLTVSELNKIGRYTSLPQEPFDEKNGDFEWNLLVAIPFDLLGIDSAHLPTKIRANFYACANGLQQPYFVSWSPIETPKPDFHRPEFFGELSF